MTNSPRKGFMTAADSHLQCESLVRISLKDLNGPLAYVLSDTEHPDPDRYPGVKVARCYLAADHGGQCELWVDGTGSLNDPAAYMGHWITWPYANPIGELPTEYEWVRSPDLCNAESPNRYGCTRPAGHSGGHAFTAWMASPVSSGPETP